MKMISTHVVLAAWLAASAGIATAQSSVSLYGILDAGAYSKQLAGETRLKTLSSGVMSTSRWGFRGSEDLGGGVKALFDVSSFLRADTGEQGRFPNDAMYSRYSWVGLSTPTLGRLRLGRVTTPGFLLGITTSPFGDSTTVGPYLLHTYLGSASQPLMTGGGVTDSAWSNSVAYNTPVFGGFSFSAQLAAGEGTTAGRRSAVGANYANGPFTLGVAYDKLDKMSLSFSKPPASILMEDGSTLQAAATYDFKVVKLFAKYGSTQLERPGTEIKLGTVAFGALMPLGSGRLMFEGARTNKEQTLLTDVKRTTISFGYGYDFSKRTDLYAVVMSDKLTGVKSGFGYTLGIRHNF
ncbi:porin [Roseateles sp. P5_E7]